MIFTFSEIIDIIVMTAIIGFIFKDIFKNKPHTTYDPLKPTTNNGNFWFAAISVGLSIVFHELGHKFIAMFLGLHATFHAAYSYLGLGLLLKLINFNFIFFVPAYINHSPTIPLYSAMIAFAGPCTNLIIWFLCGIIIKNNWIQKRYLTLIYFTKYINGFLFIVNMLPIPGLDGYWVLTGLINSL